MSFGFFIVLAVAMVILTMSHAGPGTGRPQSRHLLHRFWLMLLIQKAGVIFLLLMERFFFAMIAITI